MLLQDTENYYEKGTLLAKTLLLFLVLVFFYPIGYIITSIMVLLPCVVIVAYFIEFSSYKNYLAMNGDYTLPPTLRVPDS